MEVIHYPVSLDLSIGDFFKKVLREESLFPPPQHTLSLSLLEKFQAAGCDYYELTAIATASRIHFFCWHFHGSPSLSA